MSSPCISEGVLYDGCGMIGRDHGLLYAFDLQKGEKLWEFRIEKKGIHSSPVINDGLIYFGAEDGYFYALY